MHIYLFVCLCISMRMHAYICMHVCIYIYMSLPVNIRAYIHVDVCAHVCIMIRICVCVSICEHAFVVCPCSPSCFACVCLTPPSSFLCILGLSDPLTAPVRPKGSPPGRPWRGVLLRPDDGAPRPEQQRAAIVSEQRGAARR